MQAWAQLALPIFGDPSYSDLVQFPPFVNDPLGYQFPPRRIITRCNPGGRRIRLCLLLLKINEIKKFENREMRGGKEK